MKRRGGRCWPSLQAGLLLVALGSGPACAPGRCEEVRPPDVEDRVLEVIQGDPDGFLAYAFMRAREEGDECPEEAIRAWGERTSDLDAAFELAVEGGGPPCAEWARFVLVLLQDPSEPLPAVFDEVVARERNLLEREYFVYRLDGCSWTRGSYRDLFD